MSIKIQKVVGGYLAKVMPPDVKCESWQSVAALSAPLLVKELLALGCHQTDIGDALYEADPNWLGQ